MTGTSVLAALVLTFSGIVTPSQSQLAALNVANPTGEPSANTSAADACKEGQIEQRID